MNRSLLSSGSQRWGTPWPFYNWLNSLFHFTIDLAAETHNAKHRRFYTPAENSLKKSWANETGFGNWPYGRGEAGITPWVRKAQHEALYAHAVIVQVVPARVDTKWWRAYVMNTNGEAGELRRSAYVAATRVLWLGWAGMTTGIYFHDRRLPFETPPDAPAPKSKMGKADSAPFPTAVVWHIARGCQLAKPDADAVKRGPLLTVGCPWPT